MISFSCTNENYRNDLMELVRAFEQRTDEELSLAADYALFPGEMRVEVTADKFGNFRKFFRFPYAPADAMEAKRLEKRYLKIALYGVLVFLTGRELPYGCLTGIRPTKLYAELGEGAHDVFLQDFSVRPEKLALIERIVSFVSMPVDRQRKLLRPYTDDLTEEIGWLKKRAKKLGYSIRAVYVGGGTPTALPLDMLDEVLAACRVRGAKEFTVEAGRPDTITEEALALLKSRGVTRVSVNPQTFNDETLKRIGRRHTAADVERAYALARDRFDVNMDLIAMLPGESAEDFFRTVDRAAELSPANVTVHTLYLKKGSELRTGGYKSTENSEAERMVDYALTKLSASGYEPYYMYRQKYTSGNLENVGYTKPGKACLYNMDVMEEDTTVFAAGAAAISKKVTPAINLIERNANYKEPLEYVKHFDTVMQKQKDFWK